MQEIRIDLYLSDLLYSYDCVIVPEFGGFIANYASAEIKPIQHKFLPPSKSISFNKNLKNNDGLLLNHIAQRRSIAYEEAKQLVHDFVHRSITGLNQGDRIYFENIGVLYLDPEGNVQFEAAEENDYLLESFGMSSFRAQPIIRKSKEASIESTVEKVIPLVKAEEKRKRKLYWPAAAIFFFLLSLTLMFQPQLTSSQLQFSKFNLFSSSPAVYVPIKIDRAEELALEESKTMRLSSELQLYEGSVGIFVEGETTAEVEEDNTAVVVSQPQVLRYHVMGGCFSSANNAKKLVNDLISEGYSSQLLGEYKSLHAVSYQSFATREEAVQLLEKVRNYHNPGAWLLVREF